MRSRRIFGPLLLAGAVAVVGIPDSSGQAKEPIPDDELPRFLGDVPPDQITWHVVHNIDFAVYVGKANPPLHGSVSFYVGGFPQAVERGQTVVQSRLGQYRAKWQRTVGSDGSIDQEAIISLRGHLGAKVHVWANAANEEELQKLLSTVARLPIFSSGRLPDRFHGIEAEIFKEQRISQITWIAWWTVTLTSAWFAGRICRRRRVSAPARPLIFAGVVALWVSVSVVVAIVSPPAVVDWGIKTDAFRLLCAATFVATLAVLLAGGMFLVRRLRTPAAMLTRRSEA